VIVTSRPMRAAHPPAQQELAAFEAVFYEYYTRVYAVLFRLVGDPAEAEDLALETFWKLWQQPPSRRDNLGGWLYRVATRLGYNALRAAQRRGRYEEAAGEALQPSGVADPAGEAERARERARVRAILGRMPERDARLLVLRHSGLSYKEIATALGVSPNSVGTLLARAEAEFERLYSEGEDHAHRR
jgi:RNA polymerase sigma-70 factor (ECF subfamily)